MSRSKALVLAAAVSALSAVGCAHCDTCNKFPVPENAPSLGSYTEAIPTTVPGGFSAAPIVDADGNPLPLGTGPFQVESEPAQSRPPSTLDSKPTNASRPATDAKTTAPATPPASAPNRVLEEPPVSPPAAPDNTVDPAPIISPPTALR